MTELIRTENGVQFALKDDRLVNPLWPHKEGQNLGSESPCRIQIKGLKRGNYELWIDGVAQLQAGAREWARGIILAQGPAFDQAEALRHSGGHAPATRSGE